MAELKGIDVSRWQRGFNLQYALNAGFTYLILKAGGGDAGFYKDVLFDQFYKQAKSMKFEKIGAYYFGCAFSIAMAIKEANYFLQYLQGTDIKKVYYDVEGKMLNQNKGDLTNIVRAFCDTVNAAGYTCGIYSSEYYFNHGMVDAELKNYPHWVAKYSKNSPKLISGAPVEMWQYGGSTNYIRDPKIAGTTVDQDFILIPWTEKQSGTVKPITPKDVSYDTIHQLALEVLQGKYGSGAARKQALGELYSAVQAEVNAIVEQRAEQKVIKSTDQLANEVLAGMHGSGLVRKINLGDRYEEVQLRVNQIILERNSNGFMYTIVKGDNLTKIAKKYNTTVAKLVDLNSLENPNKIWVGQMIRIS